MLHHRFLAKPWSDCLSGKAFIGFKTKVETFRLLCQRYLVKVWSDLNLDEDLGFLVLLHLWRNLCQKVDVDSDLYGDNDEVHADDADFDVEDVDVGDKVDVDYKVDVEDAGQPQRQAQGAPHESELEAEPLSLSTFQSNHHHHGWQLWKLCWQHLTMDCSGLSNVTYSWTALTFLSSG